MNEAAFSRPRLVVSKCLGFDRCRYDGSIVSSSVVAALRDWADFIPVCPEMEIGLGVPRPPIRIVQAPQGPRLLQPATGRDLTDAMQAFAASFLDALPPVDGFVLKNRSPSCGLKDAKVYASAEKGPSVGVRAGFFGGVVVARFPDLPAEDEGRLTNRALREHFFTAVFALARLREAVDTGQMGRLVNFHTRHKFLLMALSQKHLQELGRIIANPERLPVREVLARYTERFRAGLARPFRRPSAVNVLLHAFGYVSDRLSTAEKGYFLDTLIRYREGQIPLTVPVGVLRAWIVRFNEPYLAEQAFFRPFPEVLMMPLDSGGSEP